MNNLLITIGLAIWVLPLIVYWLTFVSFKTWWKRWIAWAVIIVFLGIAVGRIPEQKGELMGTMLWWLLFINGCRWVVKGFLLVAAGGFGLGSGSASVQKYVEEAKRLELEIERRRDL
jgi:hypothetical protein